MPKLFTIKSNTYIGLIIFPNLGNKHIVKYIEVFILKYIIHILS